MRSKESVGKTALARDFSVKWNRKWAVAGVRCGVKRGFFVKMEDTLNVRKKTLFCGCKACIWEKWGEKESSVAVPPSPKRSGALTWLPCLLSSSFWCIFNCPGLHRECYLRVTGERNGKEFGTVFLAPYFPPSPPLLTPPPLLSTVCPQPGPHSHLWSSRHPEEPKGHCSSRKVTTKAWRWASPGLPRSGSEGFLQDTIQWFYKQG